MEQDSVSEKADEETIRANVNKATAVANMTTYEYFLYV